ncbi:MAG TPA: DUF3383 family protein, partial [Stellaceae bacterium]|nr:DUF3383 family protein [Stellaceae bacterium]
MRGAVPAGQCPQIIVAGDRAPPPEPLPSQADVKTRYPDGSVEYAVMATVVPAIPAGGTVTLSFEAGGCGNEPLTRAQMLGTNFNFDAQIALAVPAGIYGASLATAANQISTWTAITNGGFSIAVNGATYQLTGLDFSGQTAMRGVATVVKAALKAAAAPATIAYQKIDNATGAISRFVVVSTLDGPGSTIAAATAPAFGTDISGLLGLAAGSGPTIAQGGAPKVSARTMLANGDYKLLTSGPVAQTIILADDSAQRRYDIGFGDGYHPLRPRFYATFWPLTHQVLVRAVGENDLTSEVEDLAYKFTLTGGTAAAAEASEDLSGAQKTHPKRHWAMTAWSKSFWLGGTPSPQVDIDNNLAYLETTRFLPNYD